jgi:ribosomal protein L29
MSKSCKNNNNKEPENIEECLKTIRELEEELFALRQLLSYLSRYS